MDGSRGITDLYESSIFAAIFLGLALTDGPPTFLKILYAVIGGMCFIAWFVHLGIGLWRMR